MKKIIILLFAILLTISSFAQEKKKGEVEHAFGFAAGTTTGVGPSYRFLYHGIGMQFAFLPMISEEYSYYNAGITFIVSLNKYRHTRLFLYQSNNWVHSSSSYNRMKNGLGLGFEFASDHFSLNLMGGYANYDFKKLYPTVEIAFFYKFSK